MKKLFVGALVAVLGMTVLAQAQPDPRDSIILESRSVAPGANPGGGTDTAAYVYLKVYITNKDTLTAITLPLKETSLSGGAYMTLARPRTFNGCVSRLTNTLNGSSGLFATRYHSDSPDSFDVVGVFDPLNPASREAPNAARKAFWEIKFDTVFNNTGTIEFDTAIYAGDLPTFTDSEARNLAVNIRKSVVTVVNPLKGDLNLDGDVSPADVVLELQAVYLGEIPPAGQSVCDLNCDGQVTAADVAVFLNFKYLGSPWPC